MNPELQVDDPSDDYAALKSAWRAFKTKTTKLTQAALARVDHWREAESVILPIHPFSLSIDTTRADGIWRDRTSLFVKEVKNANYRVRHGFDKSGQILIAEGRHFSHLVLPGEGYFDVAGVCPSAGEFVVMPTRPHYARYCLDDHSLITRILDYSPTENHHLSIETFHWRKGRLMETHIRKFDSGKGLASWMKDLPPEEQATLYRQVNQNYREYLPARRIKRFSYDKAGTLMKVDTNQLHLPDHIELLYTRSEGGTVASTFETLVPMLRKEIVAALKKAKSCHPLRAIALVYSAEHVHCGLPHALASVSPNGQSGDLLDLEAYTQPIEWPILKPSLQKAINQYILAVEASPEHRDSRAPMPYRQLLWRVALEIAKELQSSKISDPQLTVLPLDDHGDIQPRADFLACVSKQDRKFFPLIT